MECVFRAFLLGDGAVCGGGGEEERGFSVGFCGGESHRLRFGFGSRLWGSMRENFDVENEIRGFEFRSEKQYLLLLVMGKGLNSGAWLHFVLLLCTIFF